jgi:hypothetical protein
MVIALVGGFCFLEKKKKKKKKKKLVFTKDIHLENRKLDELMTSAYEMTLKVVVCDAFEETLLQHCWYSFFMLCFCDHDFYVMFMIFKLFCWYSLILFY